MHFEEIDTDTCRDKRCICKSFPTCEEIQAEEERWRETEGDWGGQTVDGGRREWILPIGTHMGKDTGVFILFFQLSYKAEMTAEVKKLLPKGGGKILIWQAKKLQMRLTVLLEVAWVIGRKESRVETGSAPCSLPTAYCLSSDFVAQGKRSKHSKSHGWLPRGGVAILQSSGFV